MQIMPLLLNGGLDLILHNLFAVLKKGLTPVLNSSDSPVKSIFNFNEH
jgi:hypothetical protein